ncbi:MAG: hypothetical protein ACP5IE_00900 [Infirmifilum sp.]|jgi:hypothetical protein|uniref:hypothetical protein n=2 Tax=Thermofilaceae TaxID=114378 RepID=UPI0023567F45
MEYARAPSLEEALNLILERLVGISKRKGLRASKSGIQQGIGFHLDTPYIIVEGLIQRGLISLTGEKFVLTSPGETFVEYVVEIARLIKPYSLFPEFDEGRIVGAVLYALYDWTNKKDAKQIVEDARETLRLLNEVKKKNSDAFKIIAVTLPRLYFEDGKYTPSSLIEKIYPSIAHEAQGVKNTC